MFCDSGCFYHVAGGVSLNFGKKTGPHALSHILLRCGYVCTAFLSLSGGGVHGNRGWALVFQKFKSETVVMMKTCECDLPN